MPISGTTTDYTNRTVDILILGGVNPLISGPQTDTLTFGSPSQYVTGVQKLIQRYAIFLFTALGTQSNYPDFGTAFYSSVANSSYLTINTVTHIFNYESLVARLPFGSSSPATLRLRLLLCRKPSCLFAVTQ